MTEEQAATEKVDPAPTQDAPSPDSSPDQQVANEEVVSTPTTEPVTEEPVVPTVPLDRFNRIYAQDKAKDRRIAELEAQIKPEVKPEPTLEAFDYDEARHQEAMIAFKAEKIVDERMAANAQQAKQNTADNEWQQKISEYGGKYAEYSKEHPEFANLTTQYQNVEFPNVVKNALFNADSGVKLHHHILENPTILLEVDSMTNDQAVAHLAKLDARLSIGPIVSKSKAPPPIEPLKGNSGSSMDLQTAATKLSSEEYYKLTQEQR